MKDQIIALMEALRLSQTEIEKLKRKRQDVFATVAHIEAILGDPFVSAAIHNLEPLSASPSMVPEAAEEPGHVGAAPRTVPLDS
jgi:hypothetical protein